MDLILLDQKASGLDRMATLRAIRESDPTVPVYVMTGFEIEFRDRFRQMKQEGIFSSCHEPMQKAELAMASTLEGLHLRPLEEDAELTRSGCRAPEWGQSAMDRRISRQSGIIVSVGE